MRPVLLTVFALLTLSLAPLPAQPPAPKPDDAIARQLRLLEERATRAEERLALLEKVAGVTLPEVIPFGEVTVNLAEERYQRYLRVKIAIRVSTTNYVPMTALTAKKRAELRNAAITFLVDQTVRDVTGTKGIERVKDELKNRFGKILGDGKENPVLDLLFEEYTIQ